MSRLLLAVLALLAPAAAWAQGGPPPGARYVAMGSSFAAGPRITVPADAPPNRCSRSRDNYAHQVARKRRLALTDVSCSGATTAHLLGPWNELPPQLDAVDADTRLVTVTIGGNDVRLTAGEGAMACRTAAQTPAPAGSPPLQCNALPAPPTEAEWAGLAERMRRLAEEVRRRAPAARLVFVDYPSVLPPAGTCPALSLTAEQAEVSRAINRRVVAITAEAARATGSGLITASALSADHHACSASPWSSGYFRPGAPADGASFHPRLEAHTAIAEALDRLLWP